MIGIGRQGKTLSRDMDLIVADDIEDHQSTAMPSARAKTRHWWSTQVSSRKEEHTGLVIIGSRQHYEDLYGFFLGGKEEIGGWETIVDSAHDPLCDIAEHDYDAHVQCMLFPEARSYRWLLEKKTENRLTETGENFDMVYMNDPMSDAGAVFTPEAIEAAKNPQRSIGKFGIPDDVALVAGLDPATTGYQAAFLWGYHAEQDKLYMIDAKNERGGGIKPALKLIADWHQEYRLALWVVETNGWQKALIQSEEIRTYCESRGIRIMPPRNDRCLEVGPVGGGIGDGDRVRPWTHRPAVRQQPFERPCRRVRPATPRVPWGTGRHPQPTTRQVGPPDGFVVPLDPTDPTLAQEHPRGDESPPRLRGFVSRHWWTVSMGSARLPESDDLPGTLTQPSERLPTSRASWR